VVGVQIEHRQRLAEAVALVGVVVEHVDARLAGGGLGAVDDRDRAGLAVVPRADAGVGQPVVVDVAAKGALRVLPGAAVAALSSCMVAVA
jgi:hypothetical protein